MKANNPQSPHNTDSDTSSDTRTGIRTGISADADLADDTLAFTLDDTQCSEQVLLSDDEQATQADKLQHSSMAHFKIIDILGKGGMGAVYKAKDLTLERFVAIKMIRISQNISTTELPIMLAEAKTISKLNHPNIVTVYDIARDDDANFIVMEWVDGLPLNAVIPSSGLPITVVLSYAKQMVAALACAHQQQIIHRDIKPQNIMVAADGRIKVLDFGIAALMDDEASNGQSTETSNKNDHITGSPPYMSPEQINGHTSDTRSDLFSLGIVLYEMITGVKPFLGLNVKQIRQAINTGEYTPLAEVSTNVPVELIAVVDKLLQVAPSERYQSAAALAQDITSIDEDINHKKNWWQQQHWLTKTVIALPLIALLGWSIRSVLFPPSTQELIARQLVESKKIAFLPFDNISGDPVLQIFSDGMATMLSSDLAEVGYQQGDGTTWVLPASEIRQLEDPSVTGIYNKYGVDAIITGSIQHMGSTRSLHLSLINGSDGRQLKSVQLSINADNLFAAQTDIRQQVMTLLGWQIPPALNEQFAQQQPAFDGAYKHYLAGQGYLYRFDHADNIDKALAAFSKAIEIDENYADAYVGLAEAQLQHFMENSDLILLDKMEITVDKLFKVARNHPLLSYLQGELKFNKGEYIKAVTLFNRSYLLNPNFLRSYIGLSNSYLQLGQLFKAEEILLKAYELMPHNNVVVTNLGLFHFRNGDYYLALKYFKLFAQQTPNNYIAYLNISACHYLNGNIEKAIFTAKQALTIQPNSTVYSNIGTYYFILRDYKKSVEAFENMIFLNDSDYVNWGNLADAYRFAKNDKHIKTFKKAIALAEKTLQLNNKNKYAIASLAYYFANLKNIKKTIYYADKINKNDMGEVLFLISAAYAHLNMSKAAIKYLTFAINNNYSIAEITKSPLLDNLKDKPQFKQLIINLVE